MHRFALLLCLLGLSMGPSQVEGHGRLMEPPSRSSMWRFGFKTPRNYNDNELFCGGFTRQMRNGMKCGVCGDPWDAPPPRSNEAGGKYATGQIARYYRPGQMIEAAVELTANHRGHFQFRLCPVNDPKVAATDECMAKYPLQIVEATAEDRFRYHLPDRNRRYRVRVQLPSNLTCSQCVFQWTYTAGNNWGRCEDGVSRVGCGPQETFRGCSDIAIGAKMVTQTTPARQPESASRKPTASPWWPTAPQPKKNTTSAFWPKNKKPSMTTYRPQMKTPNRGWVKPKKTTPPQKKVTPLPPRKPGLEKEDGLPMIPSETKMTGFYPEPTTTKRPSTKTSNGSTKGKTTASRKTTPRTRFPPKTIRPQWNNSTTVRVTPSTKKVASSQPPTKTSRPISTTSAPRASTASVNDIPRDSGSAGSPKKKRCSPVGNYAGSKKMLEWCKLNCLHHPYYCPKSHCRCE